MEDCVSCIANVAEGKKSKLNDFGIFTVKQLLECDISIIIPGISKKGMLTFKNIAAEARQGAYLDISVDHRRGTNIRTRIFR